MTELVGRMVGLYFWYLWVSEAMALVLANEMGAEVLHVFQAKHGVVSAHVPERSPSSHWHYRLMAWCCSVLGADSDDKNTPTLPSPPPPNHDACRMSKRETSVLRSCCHLRVFVVVA